MSIQRRVLVFCGLLAFASNGCASLQTPLAAPPSTPTDGPTFFLEFHPKAGKPQRAVVALKDQMTAGQAMRETGAFRRFGRVDAVVLRRSPKGVVKMPLKWNVSTRSVEPSTDYTLYPGDRLALYPTENSALDDLLETLGVPNN